MQAWYGLGNFIGKHLALIAPACVLFATLFPDLAHRLDPYVVALFAFMTFQGSLSNTFPNVLRVAKHPQNLLIILFLSSVFMPVLSCALAKLFFGSNPDLVIGIVLEYSVPVAVVSGMWVSIALGDISLALATMLISTLISPFTIPTTLKVLLGQSVSVDAASMMGEMLISIAFPAALGVVINDLSRGRAKESLSPLLAPAAKIALILVILSNSAQVVPYIRHLTPELITVMFFILCFASFGYVLGTLVAKLLHRDAMTRATMCLQVGMRNISAGAVIAAEYLPAQSMFPVVIGTLFQQVLAALATKYLTSYKNEER